MIKRSIATTAILLLAVGAALAKDPVTVDSKYPRLAYGPLRDAEVAFLPKDTILSGEGFTITAKEFSENLARQEKASGKKLSDYNFYILEKMAVEDMLAKDAENWGKENNVEKPGSTSELINKYLESKISGVKVTDSEAEMFYSVNKEVIGDAKFEDVKDAIKDFLMEEKKKAEIAKVVVTLGARHKPKVSTTWASTQYGKWKNTPVEKARRSGKPSMVTFGADWCGPCKMMDPIRKELGKEYAGKVYFLHINVNHDPALADYYGADAVPLILFFDKSGQQTFRGNGFMDKDALDKEIAKLGVK